MSLLEAEIVNLNSHLENLSDEEVLVYSIKNPDAFSVIVDRYEDAFVRKLRMMLRASDEVQDIVQDAFVKIYLNASKYRPVPGASFKSWAYRILLNTCFTKMKKLNLEKTRLMDLEPEVVENLPDKADSWQKHLELDEFLSVISKISSGAKSLLQSIVVDGKTSEDIATAEGISISAVRTRLHRAKKEYKKASTNLI
ncbi:MAG: RNA polymerase sigma factor [Candidatus Paceibacterota bacterium]|jgi:RNA polymerase sigma-70 factor (ECF subfamily)